MDKQLQKDKHALEALLKATLKEALEFLNKLDERAAGKYFEAAFHTSLSQEGMGGLDSLKAFKNTFGEGLSGSPGARYLGFVTGGSTPAALMGDWLASVYDQNVASAGDSSANQVEYQTIAWLKDLFGLDNAFTGTFVSGATMSGFVGLSIGRQWLGKQYGVDIAQEGLWKLEPPVILSATPHSSIYKAMSMLGMGKNHLKKVPVLENREAINPQELANALEKLQGKPCIVVANAGTVNTVDFDTLEEIGRLKQSYGFYLHVDAAFGGFAACSPKFAHYVKGLNQADSMTIDMHKMMNVPYDSAIQLTRHISLQQEVFRNSGAKYLEVDTAEIPFVHLTPENSRRFRALSTWFTLHAYGKEGYREIIERNAMLAQRLGDWIKAAADFELLADVRFNVVCFTRRTSRGLATESENKAFLKTLTFEGSVFMTPSLYQGIPCIRAAFSNWQTTEKDLDRIKQALHNTQVSQTT